MYRFNHSWNVLFHGKASCSGQHIVVGHPAMVILPLQRYTTQSFFPKLKMDAADIFGQALMEYLTGMIKAEGSNNNCVDRGRGHREKRNTPSLLHSCFCVWIIRVCIFRVTSWPTKLGTMLHTVFLLFLSFIVHGNYHSSFSMHS